MRRHRRRDGIVEGRLSASISDEALLGGIAVGEGAAVREFIHRYERRVYGAAITLLRDRSLAEEVAQDVFVRVWRHADGFDPRRGSVPAWVMRITHNLCIDAMRVRRPAAVDPITLLSITDDSGDQTRGTDARAQVRDAVSHLPLEQARAVLMASMFGYDAQTISELEHIPLGTAKTRIRLGLDKLRVRLATDATKDART